MADQVKASDCKCIKCGRQAVAFWPVIDPDIPSHPYCRPCLDREKLKTLIAIYGDEKGKDYFDAWNADRKKSKKKKR